MFDRTWGGQPIQMRVEELMTEKPEMLRLRDTAADAAARMRDGNIGFMPVVDDAEQVVGVLTDRDLTVRVLAEARPAQTPVEDVMTEEVISCRPDDDLDRAEELMRTNQKARLVVIDESGRAAGVISLADIARYEDSCRAGDVLGDITEREGHPHP
jgi:CBS domain-containing protein